MGVTSVGGALPPFTAFHTAAQSLDLPEQEQRQPEDLPIHCSWCGRVEHVGDVTLPISNSMCATCCDKWHAEMDAIEAAK
jgi:hypothetical protein